MVNFNHRLAKIIKDRVHSLEEALQTRDEVGDGVQEAADWMEDVQNDLKKIPKFVGPTVNDAEETLKQYEVNMSDLCYVI